MKKTTTQHIELTAEEVCKKFGIKGKIISFATPTNSNNKSDTAAKKVLNVRIEVIEN